MSDHNIDRLVDALRRLTIEVQLFREAFVANNMSICESCSNNPCNKKAMLGDRRILECTMYDRKTEPSNSEIPNNSTISKMEQVDKDINVRSKDEPQTEARKFLGFACETCKHRDEEWDSEACDGCCENNDHYEPKDEPQTCEECEHWNDTEDGCADRHGCKTEPQTDPCDGCVCDDGKHLMYCMNCKGIAWKTKPPCEHKQTERSSE